MQTKPNLDPGQKLITDPDPNLQIILQTRKLILWLYDLNVQSKPDNFVHQYNNI